ncbi:MAG: hypothetical protein FWG50_00170 [Kiritimatiellaeota bacterium]|nr:hypothetical protein [Kiritimatiellota bacterium]
MKINKAVGFVLTSMAAGFLSGIFAPHVWGVRGAIFGGMLALGVLAYKKHGERKGHLAVAQALLIAIALSLAATLLIWGW